MMLSDPRSIAFIIDLVHPQFAPSTEAVRKLYARLVEDGGPSYANLNFGPGGAQMSTVHGPAGFPGATRTSGLTMGAQRIRIEEQWTELTPEQFTAQATRCTELIMEEFAVTAFPQIQCTVRSLVSVQGVQDSRQFFDEYYFGFDEQDATRLGRTPGLFGLRMVFPADPEDQSVHNVRIESFQNDVRSLFLEECGVYPGPVSPESTEVLTNAFQGSYDFLTENVVEYLRGRLAGNDPL